MKNKILKKELTVNATLYSQILKLNIPEKAVIIKKYFVQLGIYGTF